MKFSGVSGVNQPVFLSDSGVDITSIINLLPNNYPLPAARTFTAMAVNINTPIPAASSLTATILKNGAPTGLTVTFPAGSPANVPLSVAVPVAFALNQLYDLQVTTTGLVVGTTGVSASVAVSP